MPANMRRAVQAGTTWPADANWKGAPGPEESRYLGSVSTTVHSTVIGQLTPGAGRTRRTTRVNGPERLDARRRSVGPPMERRRDDKTEATERSERTVGRPSIVLPGRETERGEDQE